MKRIEGVKVVLASFGVTFSQRYVILQNRKERNVQAVGALRGSPAP